MEQTLGKRIVENRKRIGLTQDQLAERLGVTAQAVSKWENDQSCPDISILPKLADIFSTTTDVLLGREEPIPVRTAEVVSENEEENEDTDRHTWELKWNAGKKESLSFAVLVLLVGGLLLLSKMQLWDISFWSILWPSALLVYGVRWLFSKFSFFSLGCTLFGGYFLASNLNILKIDLNGEFVFPIIVVVFGASLLVDALRKPRKPEFFIRKNGVKLNSDKQTKRSFTTDTDSFETGLTFGEGIHLIELNELRHGQIDCAFGSLTVDLCGCMQVAEDCEVDADCAFGELKLLVPKRFLINLDRSSAFGSIEISGQPDSAPIGVIQLDADVSFGHIEIHYM